MTPVRSKSGINKTDGRHEERANRVRRCVAASPSDDVVSYLEFGGRICQETLCDRSSVTLDVRQPLALGNGFIEAMRTRIDNCSDCMYWLADQHLTFSLLWRNWPEHLNRSGALQPNPPRPRLSLH